MSTTVATVTAVMAPKSEYERVALNVADPEHPLSAMSRVNMLVLTLDIVYEDAPTSAGDIVQPESEDVIVTP